MAAVTLRPNANGDVVSFTGQFPASGAHYDKVDEVVADEDTTYVYNTYGANLEICLAIKEGGVITKGDNYSAILTTSYSNQSKQWNTPPSGGVWTPAKIDALQIGVSGYDAIGQQVYDLFKLPASGIYGAVSNIVVWGRLRWAGLGTNTYRATQLWVVVTYTPTFRGSRGVLIG